MVPNWFNQVKSSVLATSCLLDNPASRYKFEILATTYQQCLQLEWQKSPIRTLKWRSIIVTLKSVIV
jgi:hypothetical protein